MRREGYPKHDRAHSAPADRGDTHALYRRLAASGKPGLVDHYGGGGGEFLVVWTMQEGDMTLFAAGRYLHQVMREAGAWKFARKTVVLDNRQIDTLLAIPL